MQVSPIEAVAFHWEWEPETNLLVKVVIWETQIHMCVPRGVQMFIQSGAAIAGQIETDFFKTPNGFDI